MTIIIESLFTGLFAGLINLIAAFVFSTLIQFPKRGSGVTKFLLLIPKMLESHGESTSMLMATSLLLFLVGFVASFLSNLIFPQKE